MARSNWRFVLIGAGLSLGGFASQAFGPMNWSAALDQLYYVSMTLSVVAVVDAINDKINGDRIA